MGHRNQRGRSSTGEVRATHGGDKILYYGGGGQGNHLGGAYGAATRRALGITRRSNALAQEKTGEAWVDGRMVGTHTTPDFHEAEVGMFLGKNPWHSHGIPEARRTLKAMSADPDRALIVVDPRRTETAELADYFLQLLPGTDAFLVAALAAVIVQDGLAADRWLAENTVGSEPIIAALGEVPSPSTPSVAASPRICSEPPRTGSPALRASRFWKTSAWRWRRARRSCRISRSCSGR